MPTLNESDELISKLRELAEDPVLGGQVEDAFDDMAAFVESNRNTS
ncbi:hypothetical protein [Amycolatopsis sp. WAC 01375]|nr:hypothetical protein [Amycolatopsis sp. WAC 01375]